MSIRFDGRVAIVTGAGAGLGRAHALELGRRGAKLVVNDFGGGVDGTGGSSAPAEKVAEEIRAAGGEAISNGADITSREQVENMVAAAMEEWGRVDILINNAGILRDASFAKMTIADFQKVMDVHLMGSVICTKAVWGHMRDAGYGRILMTTSSSGLYGNFGQSNYGAAKMALIGLMNTLQIEGEKNDIRVNALGPGAATRMTESLLPAPVVALMTPESVTPPPSTLSAKTRRAARS
jgi:NAD(P)-dependent dehydrogenase (short-subunit alcohol dehydrogenase family)